ncbi:GDSL esterase/lipase [Ceratocystis lukuohia]|uniref:GDSL esterase/lipase n=1 Tax=Ceratocystis lukuohia TaxID=2019550 RepID=A0ABR4MJ46_9PEZI
MLFMLGHHSGRPNPNSPQTLPPQIVLLGDSLFEFCVPLSNGFSFYAELQNYLIRRYDVVNRGFSGWNTANMVPRIAQIIQPPSASVAPIKYLVVLLGSNDAVLPMPATMQHVPIDVYRANLKAIISHPNIQAHNPTIILVTPPPVDEIRMAVVDVEAGYPCAIRKATTSAAYSQVVREVASESSGVLLVDLWRGVMDKAIEMEGSSTACQYDDQHGWLGDPKCGRRGGLETLLPDGLHMNGDAYRVFFDLLKVHLPQPDEDKSDYVFPAWRMLNGGM